MIEQLIKHLEEELALNAADLKASEADRWFKLGQLEVLEWIKNYAQRGFPEK